MKTLLLILSTLFVFTACQTTEKKMSQKILFVVTSHNEIPGVRPTGAYFSEIAHPYEVLTEAGFEIEFASPQGGETPLDGMNDLDEVSRKLSDDQVLRQALNNTRKVSEVKAADYRAVFFAGGHGTMYDLPENQTIAELTAAVYEKGGVVGAVCHGPVALVNVKLSNGEYLVAGKEVAAFTNDEEEAVQLTEAMPFLLESKLIERGAKHVKATNFQPKSVTSGRLVTGQNPASATEVGERIRKLLLEER